MDEYSIHYSTMLIPTDRIKHQGEEEARVECRASPRLVGSMYMAALDPRWGKEKR